MSDCSAGCAEPERERCSCELYGAWAEHYAFHPQHPELQKGCEMCEPPAKKYRTIVVDPPWAFERELPEPHHWLYRADREGRGRTASANYNVLGIADIAAIPVGDWAEDENAHMYLWTTNTFMVEAHDLMKVWGFRQKTILTWVKPRLGMGTYYRNNTEHVLFGVRPKSPVLRKDVRTAFTAEQGRHSEKPAAFYDIVESMSPGPYLDVFARKLRFNWDAWGNEVYNVPGLPQVGIEP